MADMTVSKANSAKIRELWARCEPRISSANCVEDVACAVVDQLYEEFSDSLVLARLFLSVPFQSLPDRQRQSASEMARSAQLESLLTPTTPVHSLLASRGAVLEWNDVAKSRGHVAIPLLSQEFVGSIPMMSRLLKDLLLPLTWVQDPRGLMLAQTIGSEAGYFHVLDAANDRDEQGRLIIPAQEFVSAHGVKSVFAVGGMVFGGAVLVIILFSLEHVEVRTVRTFIPLIGLLRAALIARYSTSRIFRSTARGGTNLATPRPIPSHADSR